MTGREQARRMLGLPGSLRLQPGAPPHSAETLREVTGVEWREVEVDSTPVEIFSLRNRRWQSVSEQYQEPAWEQAWCYRYEGWCIIYRLYQELYELGRREWAGIVDTIAHPELDAQATGRLMNHFIDQYGLRPTALRLANPVLPYAILVLPSSDVTGVFRQHQIPWPHDALRPSPWIQAPQPFDWGRLLRWEVALQETVLTHLIKPLRGAR